MGLRVLVHYSKLNKVRQRLDRITRQAPTETTLGNRENFVVVDYSDHPRTISEELIAAVLKDRLGVIEIY